MLDELAKRHSVDDWAEAAKLFRKSGGLVSRACEAAMNGQTKAISELMSEVADVEESAYEILGRGPLFGNGRA